MYRFKTSLCINVSKIDTNKIQLDEWCVQFIKDYITPRNDGSEYSIMPSVTNKNKLIAKHFMFGKTVNGKLQLIDHQDVISLKDFNCTLSLQLNLHRTPQELERSAIEFLHKYNAVEKDEVYRINYDMMYPDHWDYATRKDLFSNTSYVLAFGQQDLIKQIRYLIEENRIFHKHNFVNTQFVDHITNDNFIEIVSRNMTEHVLNVHVDSKYLSESDKKNILLSDHDFYNHELFNRIADNENCHSWIKEEDGSYTFHTCDNRTHNHAVLCSQCGEVYCLECENSDKLIHKCSEYEPLVTNILAIETHTSSQSIRNCFKQYNKKGMRVGNYCLNQYGDMKCILIDISNNDDPYKYMLIISDMDKDIAYAVHIFRGGFAVEYALKTLRIYEKSFRMGTGQFPKFKTKLEEHIPDKKIEKSDDTEPIREYFYAKCIDEVSPKPMNLMEFKTLEDF